MNAFAYRKIITPRRLKLDYISPPICEGDFSSTGRQELSLLPLIIPTGPTGLVMDPYFGRFRLRWNRVPGALCYSIYRLSDSEDPFSPFILVAECIDDDTYDVDEGVYCVTAITPEGETECSNTATTSAPALPPPVPQVPPVEPDVPDPAPPPDIPGTCGDGSPAVPEELITELDTPDFLTEATATGATAGSSDFIIPSGIISVEWVSGYVWDDCTVSPGTPIRDAFITNSWFVYEGDFQKFLSSQFGCFGAVGDPPNCEPDVATQLLTEFPDKIFDHSTAGCGSCGPLLILPKDDKVGTTGTFTIPGSPQGGACHNGGTLKMKLLRTHAFIPQPTSLTIFNFEAIKNELFCVTGPLGGTAWNGVIDDNWNQAVDGYQAIENNGLTWVGNVRLVTANVFLIPGVKWTLDIIGEVGGEFVNIFQGEKRYGQTAQGNYGRNSGCSTLGCITLI